LFGGGVNKDERPVKAMRRELREETGFDFRDFDCVFRAGGALLYGKLVEHEFTPNLSEESAGYKWAVSIPQPIHKKIRKNIEALEEVIAHLTEMSEEI
jgi:8-oxo-dGTP pyrophosphatase MutT (NUDIX family)